MSLCFWWLHKLQRCCCKFFRNIVGWVSKYCCRKNLSEIIDRTWIEIYWWHVSSSAQEYQLTSWRLISSVSSPIFSAIAAFISFFVDNWGLGVVQLVCVSILSIYQIFKLTFMFMENQMKRTIQKVWWLIGWLVDWKQEKEEENDGHNLITMPL